MKLATSTKLKIARILFKTIQSIRWLFGKKSLVIKCNRNAISWELDLSEGIDLSIFTLGTFEPTTSRALRLLTKPGMTVLDIGANTGAHTLPLAKYVGKNGTVVAIEPTDWAFAKLETNVKLNPSLSNSITLTKATLTDISGECPKQFYASWNLTLSIDDSHPVHGGLLCTAKNADNLTLDDLAEHRLQLEKIDLIKLDVDGFEHPVLSGGINSLRRYRPLIVMELCPYVHLEHNRKIDDTISLLQQLDYIFLSEYDGETLPLNSNDILSLIPPGGGINAVLCPSNLYSQIRTTLSRA